MENAALSKPPAAPRHDYMEWEGVNILADIVRAYWSSHPAVLVWVERSGEIYGVRSNLFNGRPPAAGDAS